MTQIDYAAKSIIRQFDEVISAAYAKMTNDFLDPRILHEMAKECAALYAEKLVVSAQESHAPDEEDIKHAQELYKNILNLK